MQTSTVKLTRQEINDKCFHIVESGLQVMPPAHYNAWQSVTDESAVMVDDNIYCTEQWYKKLIGQM